jgi:hypothetical protein
MNFENIVKQLLIEKPTTLPEVEPRTIPRTKPATPAVPKTNPNPFRRDRPTPAPNIRPKGQNFDINSRIKDIIKKHIKYFIN